MVLRAIYGPGVDCVNDKDYTMSADYIWAWKYGTFI